MQAHAPGPRGGGRVLGQPRPRSAWRSARAQREAGDLARREEADLLGGEAEAAVHVQGRVALPVEAAVEGGHELGEVAGAAPGPGKRELPPCVWPESISTAPRRA